ncbi:MAG: hypothetical protein ACJ8DV_07400 [Microvirga sp.]
MHPLVALMPEVMFVGTLLERYPEILPMLEAMEREARGERAGFAGILARLADGCRSKPPCTVSAMDHTLSSVGRSSG